MKRIILMIAVCLLISCFTAFSEGDDYILAQPGDSGVDVELLLAKCAEMGFIRDLPEGADEYLEEYIPNVMEMEKKFGFVEDGIVHLSEFEEIEGAIQKGAEGEEISALLERLYDLGYIKNVLPEDHSVYDKKYESAVKSAEKKLGLNPDGILTVSELETINSQPFEPLEEVKSIKLKTNKDKVTVSWSAVKGAVYYKVFRGAFSTKPLATVYGKTSYIDEEATMGQNITYYVVAYSYNRESPKSKTKTIMFDIYYTPVKLIDICREREKWNGEYVKLSSLKVYKTYISGSDYMIEVGVISNGVKFSATLVLEFYRSWNWNGKSIEKYKLKRIDSAKGRVNTTGSTLINLEEISYTY